MSQVVTIQPACDLSTLKKRQWSHKLFQCQCKDSPCTCVTVSFCYPCYMSRIGTRIGENPCTPCCVPCSALPFRTKMRTMYNITGSVTNDCCVTTFCCCCAACQMNREMDFLKEQGLA